MSLSHSTTNSFTLTNAKKLAAKVIADMHQCHRLYGEPDETEIDAFLEELVVLLAAKCVLTYEFGFKTQTNERVLSWRYTVTAAGDLEGGRSGGLWATADVAKARSFNRLTRSDVWSKLSESERGDLDAKHSIRRTESDGPTDVLGRWVRGRNYVSGGVAIERKEFRPW